MTTPLCILLVDDSPFFLNLCSRFLKNTPATLIVAENAAKAVALAREHHPNLIYLDLDMPDTNGAECCRTLKANPELADIPVIIMGDQANLEGRELAMAAGCDDYLAKPLDRREFLQVGHNFLFSIDRREPRKPLRIPVTITWQGVRREVQCSDLSTGGMFLVCQPEAEVGAHLMLQFDLPWAVGRRVSLKGRVAWVNHAAAPYKPDYPEGYGVEFLDVPEAVGAALRRHLGSS